MRGPLVSGVQPLQQHQHQSVYTGGQHVPYSAGLGGDNSRFEYPNGLGFNNVGSHFNGNNPHGNNQKGHFRDAPNYVPMANFNTGLGHGNHGGHYMNGKLDQQGSGDASLLAGPVGGYQQPRHGYQDFSHQHHQQHMGHLSQHQHQEQQNQQQNFRYNNWNQHN